MALPALLTRRIAPSGVVSLSQITWPARVAAVLRRATGRCARVELYFAFDDPCSAIAVLDLVERLAGHRAELVLLPVVERGIAGDPAVDAKRRYAIADARRLARRTGRALMREEPIAASTTAPVAAWMAGADQDEAQRAFCLEALAGLWLHSRGAVHRSDYAAMWRRHLGGAPIEHHDAVTRNERRMRRRGPYDTPAAFVHGQWFFAHDRGAQIAQRLDDLGWGAPA
jgi:2-hydroxychromene-2-carboxylate isomerase